MSGKGSGDRRPARARKSPDPGFKKVVPVDPRLRRNRSDAWVGVLTRVWRIRPWRWVLVALGSLAILFGISAWLITYTDIYKGIPAAVWKKGDIGSVAVAAALLSPEQRRQLDSIRTANSRAATSPPVLVAKAAEAWVVAVNENNPGAIIYNEADSFGNLYLVFGPWWDLAKDDHRLLALDAIGVSWREYIKQQFPVIERTGFQPGIFILDEHGRVAQNVNGQVELLRQKAR